MTEAMRRPLLLVLLAAASAAAGQAPDPRGGVPEGCAEAVTLFCADPAWPNAQAMERERRPGPPPRLRPLAAPSEPPPAGAVSPRP